MGATEANKEAEENFNKGLNAAWFALKTLRDHDYDIDMWLDEYSPREAVDKACGILADDVKEKYGIRISFEEAWCEKPTEKYVNPLEKRMMYHPPKSIEKYDGSVSGLKVGCEVFDTSIKEYAILISLDHVPVGNKLVATLTDGTVKWFTRVDKIMPTTYVKKTVDDLKADDERRKKEHVVEDGDIVKIIVVPSMHADMNVGSYQKISEHFDGKYYIRDGKNVEYEFTEDMFELME